MKEKPVSVPLQLVLGSKASVFQGRSPLAIVCLVFSCERCWNQLGEQGWERAANMIKEMELVHSERRRGKPSLIKLARWKLRKIAAYKYTDGRWGGQSSAEGELFMPEDSVGRRTNVRKLARNKFSLETGRSFLTIRE